jgi:type I restriction enzyme R subunit
MTPEQQARQEIDRLLTAAGWHVCGVSDANIHAARGVAIREFALDGGYGYADYLLYVDGKAAGVIEAKKAGVPLIGVEHQSGRYVQGLPAALPAWRRPLPFAYESTGIETHFTSGLDPEPRSRPVFAFHQPATLADWLGGLPPQRTVPVTGGVHDAPPTDTFRRRLRSMPELITEWGDQKLWPAQIQAIRNLEKSLAADKPRALIQMATGSGKTFTAISAIYRLIKFAGARRVLFLVDRGNLGRQAKKEFDQYVSPVNNYKFGEEYIVQHLASNQLDRTARVCISTIQRMYSMLKGRELPEDEEERSTAGVEGLFREVEPIDYNPAFPIETFDIIVTDEAHRSIYNLWRQILEYFDAYLIGLTATPKALDKPTRARRDWQLDDDFEYAPEELDRSEQTPDQFRIIARTLRDTVRDLLRTRQLAIEQRCGAARSGAASRQLRRNGPRADLRGRCSGRVCAHGHLR